MSGQGRSDRPHTGREILFRAVSLICHRASSGRSIRSHATTVTEPLNCIPTACPNRGRPDGTRIASRYRLHRPGSRPGVTVDDNTPTGKRRLHRVVRGCPFDRIVSQTASPLTAGTIDPRPNPLEKVTSKPPPGGSPALLTVAGITSPIGRCGSGAAQI